MKYSEANKTSFTPAPAGTHLAICFGLIDLGTQETTWQGKSKLAHKILMMFELCDEFIEIDGVQKPETAYQRYTFSSSPKASLRQHLESWRGKTFTDGEIEDFDMQKLVGRPCLLTIVHQTKEGKTYANITSISAPPKNTTVPKQFNEDKYLELTEDGFDMIVFESLSDKLKETIAKSPEYQAIKNPPKKSAAASKKDARTSEELDDEIPF